MKKIYLVLALALTTTLVNAQTAKNKMRIMLGYGFPNVPAAVLGDDVDTKTGPYQIGYKLFLSDNFSVGLMYNTASATTKTAVGIDENLNPYSYNFDLSFSTFLTQLDYSWANKPTHNWYSGLSLGYSNVSAKVNVTTGSGNPTFTAASSGLAYHLTLVGYHGTLGKGFGVYSELGYGFNGIFNGGFSYSFN